MKRNLALLSLVIVSTAAVAAPAMAEDDEGPLFDLRYAYELQSWSVPGTAGTPLLGFSAPMHTYTVSDHSGMVLALGSSVARTQGGRMAAEQEARRRGDASYSYTIHMAQPQPGLRLGMTVGLGEAQGLSGTSLAGAAPVGAGARLFSLATGSDMFGLFTGTLGWDLALTSFSVATPNSAGTSFTFSSTQVPFGLSYRLGLPIVPLLVEPFARLDVANWMGSGFKSFSAMDYGVRAALVLHPMWRLEGRWNTAQVPQAGVTGANKGDLATVSTLAVGTTMYF